jgi:ribosomal 50S subunit-associated protein YjgA (DUF615 family)
MENDKKKYLYLLEIVDEEKEIIITKCEKLLWNLIPYSDEAFDELLKNYPGYEVYEIDENLMRKQGDLHSYMNPN